MLRAKHVSFCYPSQEKDLPPVSLEVPAGRITLLTGPSGSGKSTLARCLMGLIPHLYHGRLSGQVWLNGYRTADVPLWRLSQQAGMVFQNPASQMLAPTVEDEIVFGLENLGLEPGAVRERLESALRQFGLAALRYRNPLSLSGGEQQKLALAAVVARKPQALILDEPLSMLDTAAAGDLIASLEAQAKSGVAVAVLEHRREYVSSVERLEVVDLEGRPQPDTASARRLALPSEGRFSLEIEGVTVEFGASTPLRNLSLSLPGGQVVAIVGRNGAGKTTLLRAIAGLQRHSGSIRIAAPGADVPPDVGMVFQNPDLQLFNGSVREEILYRVHNPDLGHYAVLLDALGLRPYESTPPLLLSEGEKKRLSLALVLMRKPRHGVLLDEPSLGQDTRHKTILTGLLRALADAGQLAVMTTHDLNLASQADRLILLGPEGVIADGPTGSVLRDGACWQEAGLPLPGWFRPAPVDAAP